MDTMLRLTDETLPRRPEFYARMPAFDPEAFLWIDGCRVRHMLTPLDDHYLVEPVDDMVPGLIPPQEVELRDSLTAVVAGWQSLGVADHLCAAFGVPSPRYEVVRQLHAYFVRLTMRSPEHRAALCRFANSQAIAAPILREHLFQVLRAIG